MESIFELLENLNLVLANLDPELGTAQPQLVTIFFKFHFWECTSDFLDEYT